MKTCEEFTQFWINLVKDIKEVNIDEVEGNIKHDAKMSVNTPKDISDPFGVFELIIELRNCILTINYGFNKACSFKHPEYPTPIVIGKTSISEYSSVDEIGYMSSDNRTGLVSLIDGHIKLKDTSIFNTKPLSLDIRIIPFGKVGEYNLSKAINSNKLIQSLFEIKYNGDQAVFHGKYIEPVILLNLVKILMFKMADE